MKQVMRWLILSSMFALMVGCAKESPPAVEGNPAPNLKVTGRDGKTVQLSDLRGEVVMVNFWATWCPPCREEIPSLMRLNAAMAGKPFRMLAVSIDEGGAAKVEQFLRTTGSTLPVFFDPARKAGNRYGITGVPETFIIDKKGVIVKKIIGPLPWDDPQVIGFLSALAGA